MDTILVENAVRGVDHRERNGLDYLVAPVTAMRSMQLHKGYVPVEEIEKSQPAWNGTPLSLNHPTNSAGMVSLVSSPRIEDRYRIGTLYNTDVDGDVLTGEAWIIPDVANGLSDDGRALVDRLERGDAVSVSTSYFGDRLPAGNYDGEYRDAVMGNLRPDHLALLPNSEGRCSIEDGCMAGAMAANSSDSDSFPSNIVGERIEQLANQE